MGIWEMICIFFLLGSSLRIRDSMITYKLWLAGWGFFPLQVLIAIILAVKFGGDKSLTKGEATGVVILVCVYVAAFAWSWGPLGWLVPSEIFPLETRSAGQAITVSTNMLFTFVVAQAFLTILCHFKYGIFLFFAGWVVIMTVFTSLFLPETKGVPIEEMIHVWRQHWFWKKIVPSAEEMGIKPPKVVNDGDVEKPKQVS